MPEKIQEVLWRGDVQEVRRAQIPFCRGYVLYQEAKDGTFIPYKKAGIRIDSRIDMHTLPAHLYISKKDAVAILGETQERFNAQLKEDLISGAPERIKATFTAIVTETLAEPRGSSYEVLSKTIDYMIDGFLRDPNVMINLVNMASNDRYDTTIHGVNVCLLTLGGYLVNGLKRQEAKPGGIAALFHDIGKTQKDFPQEIIKSNNRLSKAQFEVMKIHPARGFDFLSSNGITDLSVIEGVYQHHERYNGSGYPQGLTGDSISICGRIIWIANSYDRMTCGGVFVRDDHGNYVRRAFRKKEALERIITNDRGAYDKEFLRGFIHLIKE